MRIPHPYPGRFFNFEGQNGIGKSTQAELAYSWLRRSSCATDRDAVLTKEPYTKAMDGRRVNSGLEIYQVLKGEHARTRLSEVSREDFQRYFYFPNRIQHYLEVVIPSLEKGVDVVSDRGLASVCFGAPGEGEGVLLGLMAEQLRMFNALRLPWPDAILIYDAPAEVAMERLSASGKARDGHETLEIQEAVRQNYLFFAENWPNCHIVDATGTTEEVFNRTALILDRVLNREVHQHRAEHGVIG